MHDRERVTEHLNDCLAASRRDNTWVFVRKDIVEDAITLLKEQEHKDRMFHALEEDWKMVLKEQEAILLENQHKPYGISTNANSPWISRCPRCGKKVEGKQTRFCKYCGQAVKWE